MAQDFFTVLPIMLILLGCHHCSDLERIRAPILKPLNLPVPLLDPYIVKVR